MARKQYSLDEVLRSLSKKKDIRINGTTVLMLSDFIVTKEGESVRNPLKVNDIGNKSWGKLDFLVKHQNYNLVKVEKF